MRFSHAAAPFLMGLLLTACSDEPADPTPGSGGDGGMGSGGGPTSDAGAEIPCPGGELEVDGACVAPGVPVDGCSAGFTHDGAGCGAVMPVSACAAGMFALPGESQCHNAGGCGSGTWGDIPVDTATQYVDVSFAGVSNGSANAPWKTINDGVNAAADDAIVAVAAGTYAAVNVDHPVRVWGVCADQVDIVGAAGVALTIAGANGAEVRGVALHSAVNGAFVTGSADVMLGNVWIHDTTDSALNLQGAGAVRLDGSLIENAVGYAIAAAIADIEIVDSSIRDVIPDGNGDWGTALLAYGASATAQSVTIRRSVIERCQSFGAAVQGATNTVVEDTLIRDIKLSTSGDDGMAIWQRWSIADGVRSSLIVTGSVFERLHGDGIGVYGGDALIERTTVRDIDPPTTSGEWGAGIRFFDIGESTTPSGVIRQTTIDEAHRVGVELWGASAEVESVIIRDTRPETNGESGFGVLAYDHDVTQTASDLLLRGSVIERARQGGIVIAGSTAVIDSVAVLDTQPMGSGAFGVAVSVLTNWQTGLPASADVSRTIVDGTYAGGIVVGGGDLTVSDVIVRNVKKQVNVDDFGDGIGAASHILWIGGIIPTTLSVTRATIENVPRAAISNFGSTVFVGDSLLECNAIDLDGEVVDLENEPETSFSFDNGGDNDCGCGDERLECKVLTTNMAPPFAF